MIIKVLPPSTALSDTSDDDRTILLSCPETKVNELDKRMHDLKNALLRVSTSIKMMEQGFDFAAKDGEAYIDQLKDAHKLLKDECQLLFSIYKGF